MESQDFGILPTLLRAVQEKGQSYTQNCFGRQSHRIIAQGLLKGELLVTCHITHQSLNHLKLGCLKVDILIFINQFTIAWFYYKNISKAESKIILSSIVKKTHKNTWHSIANLKNQYQHQTITFLVFFMNVSKHENVGMMMMNEMLLQ